MDEDTRQAALELLADMQELADEMKTTVRTIRAHLAAANA